MLIGNGFISKCLSGLCTSDDIAIYARGVSNSKEISEYECRRDLVEFKCYLKKLEVENFFYLSSSDLSTYEPFSRYLLHKKDMEEIALSEPKCTVLRLPQIIGQGMGKNSLVSYFKKAILSKSSIELWDAPLRYPINSNDLSYIIENILYKKNERIVDIRPLYGLTPKQILTLIDSKFYLYSEVKKDLKKAQKNKITYAHLSIEKISQKNYCNSVIESC